MISYVIYSEKNITSLNHFLKQKNTHHFYPITKIEVEQIDLLNNKELLFNTSKAFENLNREITSEEIAHTLSHIKCWTNIAQNNEIKENEFILVAESDIRLVENFAQLAITYANKYPSYGIIKLDHNGLFQSGERLYQENDIPDALIYGNINEYNKGSSLYLIRKDVAKKLTQELQISKPYWLANQFTEFYLPSNIAQARYLLGEIPRQVFSQPPENPLFSIIIPIYNVERYLEQCIKSVLIQSYKNYEIILVDDSSPDNSIDICINYAKKYKNIIFIHKTNGGLSDARNAGINIARGKYLMFLDSDDYWEGKDILLDLSEIVIQHSPDMVIYDCQFLYPDNKKDIFISDISDLSFNYLNDFELLIENNIFRPAAWSKIVKRNLIINNKIYFPKGKNHEDLDWSYKLASMINNYSIYNVPFYIYRSKRIGSITEFVKPKNTEDLLDINIEKLSEIDKNSPFYSGLLNYLLKQKSYTVDSYNLLPEEYKSSLFDKYNKMLNLFEKHKNNL